MGSPRKSPYTILQERARKVIQDVLRPKEKSLWTCKTDDPLWAKMHQAVKSGELLGYELVVVAKDDTVQFLYRSRRPREFDIPWDLR